MIQYGNSESGLCLKCCHNQTEKLQRRENTESEKREEERREDVQLVTEELILMILFSWQNFSSTRFASDAVNVVGESATNFRSDILKKVAKILKIYMFSEGQIKRHQ